MGDPRRSRKNYNSPAHPWEKERIIREKQIVKEYGLKNKREVWKAQTRIREFRMRARELLGYKKDDRNQRINELLGRLYRLGLVEKDAALDNVLVLTVKDWLNRRLQTLVFKKGLARTQKQARQFIVHGLIAIDGKKVTIPGYIVTREEEEKIGYYRGVPKVMQETRDTQNEVNVEGGEKDARD